MKVLSRLLRVYLSSMKDKMKKENLIKMMD